MDLTQHPDAQRWDKRYTEKNEAGPACAVLRENLHLLPSQGKALDLACGLGANALLLAQQGLSVEAWDISEVALQKLQATAIQKGLDINCRQCDLRSSVAETNSFDVIVVSYFLQRETLPLLAQALRPNGLLYYQTFSRLRVDDSGPNNPEFRLADNELLQLIPDLHLRVYREEGLTGEVEKGLRNELMYIGQNTRSIV
ncbi:MAG: methyltransferase domain-containing protein [Gammaproteobacteria bacterium]|nr:methyltransferase domain-containing protein [Gammaproteobacteria bacterium]